MMHATLSQSAESGFNSTKNLQHCLLPPTKLKPATDTLWNRTILSAHFCRLISLVWQKSNNFSRPVFWLK